MPKTEELQNLSQKNEISFEEFRGAVLKDYRIANESREASLLGRKEVLSGKAKFSIFGDGKEVAQILWQRLLSMAISGRAITATRLLCLLLKRLHYKNGSQAYMHTPTLH
jgi:hypothetical protein